MAGAVLRAGAAFVPDAASALLGLAGLCWVGAFGLLCWRIGPVLWRARPDGLWGCQGEGGEVVASLAMVIGDWIAALKLVCPRKVRATYKS